MARVASPTPLLHLTVLECRIAEGFGVEKLAHEALVQLEALREKHTGPIVSEGGGGPSDGR